MHKMTNMAPTGSLIADAHLEAVNKTMQEAPASIPWYTRAISAVTGKQSAISAPAPIANMQSAQNPVGKNKLQHNKRSHRMHQAAKKYGISWIFGKKAACSQWNDEMANDLAKLSKNLTNRPFDLAFAKGRKAARAATIEYDKVKALVIAKATADHARQLRRQRKAIITAKVHDRFEAIRQKFIFGADKRTERKKKPKAPRIQKRSRSAAITEKDEQSSASSIQNPYLTAPLNEYSDDEPKFAFDNEDLIKPTGKAAYKRSQIFEVAPLMTFIKNAREKADAE